MKEDPYVFINRIANNCLAIEAAGDDLILEDYDDSENYWSNSDPVPERCDYVEERNSLMPIFD